VGKNDCRNPKDQKFQNPQNSRRFVHMIVMGSAYLLLEIRWQKGWQADQMHTLSATFLPAPSNFLSLTQAIRF
jgi:hypothetical protein